MTEALALNKWDRYLPIPGYDGLYEANGLGHIKSLRKGIILKAPIAEVREMRHLYATTDVSQSEIGRIYGIGQANAHNVLARKTWAWLE